MVYPSQRRCWPPPAAGETFDEDGIISSGKGDTAHAFSQLFYRKYAGGADGAAALSGCPTFLCEQLVPKFGPGAISGAPTQLGTHLFLHERRRVRLARLDEMCPPAKEA